MTHDFETITNTISNCLRVRGFQRLKIDVDKTACTICLVVEPIPRLLKTDEDIMEALSRLLDDVWLDLRPLDIKHEAADDVRKLPGVSSSATRLFNLTILLNS